MPTQFTSLWGEMNIDRREIVVVRKYVADVEKRTKKVLKGAVFIHVPQRRLSGNLVIGDQTFTAQYLPIERMILGHIWTWFCEVHVVGGVSKERVCFSLGRLIDNAGDELTGEETCKD